MPFSLSFQKRLDRGNIGCPLAPRLRIEECAASHKPFGVVLCGISRYNAPQIDENKLEKV